jgi:hypothetical protein
MINPDRTYISYGKLDEQCRRAVDIIERHRDKGVVIDSHRSTSLPVINRYFKQQEQLTALKTQATQASEASIQEAKALSRSLRAWLGQLSLMVSGLDSRDFSCDAGAPESVIGAAESLIDFVTTHQAESAGAAEDTTGGESGTAGEPSSAGDETAIVFAAQMIDDLTSGKTVAYEKWRDAQDRLSKEQELRNKIRGTAIEVQNALVSLRKTLRNTLGSSHRDYQKLRLDHGKRNESEDAEQLESISSTGENDSSYISDIDAVESVPLAAASGSASTDGGNGRGAVASIDPYFLPTNQANPPSGTGE